MPYCEDCHNWTERLHWTERGMVCSFCYEEIEDRRLKAYNERTVPNLKSKKWYLK